ncbi:MAG: hypothetical protein ACI86H_002848 [bacterium]|jgi:hypothetical protein
MQRYKEEISLKKLLLGKSRSFDDTNENYPNKKKARTKGKKLKVK